MDGGICILINAGSHDQFAPLIKTLSLAPPPPLPPHHLLQTESRATGIVLFDQG